MSDGGLDHYLRTQLRAALTRDDLDDARVLISIVYGVEPGAIDLATMRGDMGRAPDRGARLVEDAACKILGRPSFAQPEIDRNAALPWMLARKDRAAGFGDIYTRDPATLLVICKAIDRAQQAADWRVRNPSKLASPVLLLGETGTGKEMLARAMHCAHVARLRERLPKISIERTFGAINCAGLAEDIVESELFGHVKGAYTGAVAARAGLLVAHKDGTVLLDEIGDAPLERVQPRLLRFLQDGEVRAVGADQPIHVYPWLIAATNRPEQLREELQQRLGLSRALVLPSLAERGDDAIGALVALTRSHSSTPDLQVALTAAARRATTVFPWPGNLREVDQIARDLAAANEGQATATIDLADLPEDLQDHYREATPIIDQCADYYGAIVARDNEDERRAARDEIVREFRELLKQDRMIEVTLIHRLRRVAASPLVASMVGAEQAGLVMAFDQRLLRIEQILVARLQAALAALDGLPFDVDLPLILNLETVPKWATFVLDLIEGFATSEDAHSFTRDLVAIQDRLPTPWRRALEALPAILPSNQPAPPNQAAPPTAADTPTRWEDLRSDAEKLKAEIDRLGSASKLAKNYGLDPSTVIKAAHVQGLKLNRGRPKTNLENDPMVPDSGAENQEPEQDLPDDDSLS